METLYDVLGARPGDDAERLKNTYREAAKANHLDRHAGDPDAVVRFRRIATAYDILRDAKRRAAYDRLLEFQRGSLRSIALRAITHPSYPFAFKTIAAVVGIVVAGGILYGIVGDDVGGMTAGQQPRMVAVEPAQRADTVTGQAPSHGLARAPEMPVILGSAASAMEGKDAWEAARGCELRRPA